MSKYTHETSAIQPKQILAVSEMRPAPEIARRHFGTNGVRFLSHNAHAHAQPSGGSTDEAVSINFPIVSDIVAEPALNLDPKKQKVPAEAGTFVGFGNVLKA